MANTNEMKELTVQEKKELKKEAPTREGLFFEPTVDIYETQKELVLLADVPGATAESLEVDIRDSVLTLTARSSSVEGRWRPIYEEYRVGHYTRQFKLGQQIDQAKISAKIKDGVLTLNLPKAESAMPRRISVQVAS
jgi:HSP20 family molecular chaperone IbpA